MWNAPRPAGDEGDERRPNPLVPGTLDMLILKLLSLEPMHGYGISVRLAALSGGTFQCKAGWLFPAFRRLCLYGYVRITWRTTDKNRRAKWFEITHVGRARLRRDAHNWERQTRAVAAVLAVRSADEVWRRQARWTS